MQIESRLLARHLHQAVAEQLSEDYRRRGYSVESDVRLGAFWADLVARKGEEVVVFEIKTTEPWSIGRAEQAGRLRDYVAGELDGQFRFVLVGVPEPVDVEIEEVETVLQALAEDEVNDQLLGEASHFHSLDVEDVEYEAVRIHEGQIEVRGTASLSLVLQYGSDGDVERGDGLEHSAVFPLRFHLVLDQELRLSEAVAFKIEREYA